MKAGHLQSGPAGLPPVSSGSGWPSRCVPRKGGLGRRRPQSLKPCPGSVCASRPGLGRPRTQGALPRCVGTGVIPRYSPGCPGAHLLQAARGVRRGASGDQLLSRLPLYSGSIRRGAAYAPCQSPASRSRGGPLGGGRRVCGGRNRRIDSRTRASGTRAADGRASGQTDGLAETGGRAGGARPGRRGRGRSRGPGGGCGGTRGTVRGRPLPGIRGPAGPSLWVRRGGAGASGSAPRSLGSEGAQGPAPALSLLATARPTASPIFFSGRAAQLALNRDPGALTLCRSGERSRTGALGRLNAPRRPPAALTA